MIIETHCHSYHSFDCCTKIEDIVNKCLFWSIGAIIINDHDFLGITLHEEELFKKNGIKLYKAIEFTTSEGMHIIGVGQRIEEFQRAPCFYQALDIVKKIKDSGSWVILPHPYHETGIIGNQSIDSSSRVWILENANFIEGANYRYGNEFEKVTVLASNYKNLKVIVGSDAHGVREIGAHCNFIKDFNPEKDFLIQLHSNDLEFVLNLRRGNLYFFLKRIKKMKFYQAIIKIIPKETRLKIKKKLGLLV